MVRLRNVILLLCIVIPGIFCAADTASALDPDSALPEIERVFRRSGEQACRAVVLASQETVAHADCGMGRHCPDESRCCVTSSDFWCCPAASGCDYDRPGHCQAK